MSANPIRMLHTCLSYSWGGLEMHSLMEAERMKKKGHEVWLACCSGSRIEQEAAGEGIRVLALPVTGYVHPLVVRRVARFIRSEKIMLVHCQQSRDLALITPSVKLSRMNVPIVLSKRVGSYVTKRTPLHRFIYSTVFRVLAISEVIRQNVIETTPMDPGRVVTVHHGVDTAELSPERADGQRIRTEFGITKEEVLVGFVGRISRGKGHEDFLAAVSLLSKKHSSVRYLIVGEASHGEEAYARTVRALCSRYGLDELVTFAGFRRDIRNVMAAFDIFAFPSHAEAFGAVLIEAMALGKPVVSTNCDGVLDIVLDGQTGIYVRPGKPEELAAALDRMIREPSLREQLGRAGRRRVVECFDVEEMIRKIEGIYRDVLREAG